MSSRRVVDLVQRAVRPDKAGHAGTLDPLATGVLVVCVGPATRLIDHVQRMPKRYRGTFLLGRSSPTEDVEGEVTELENPPVPARDQIDAAAGQFVGEIRQRPPQYSALKVGGRRSYDLARSGKQVRLEPRQVTVYSLEVALYDYPELVLDIECSGGTYVRSLGRDLAESLGTAAVMSALVRTAIGRFRVEDAHDPQLLSAKNLAQWLLPPRLAVAGLPELTVTPDQLDRLRNGRPIQCESAKAQAHELAALDADGRLLAVLHRLDTGLFRPAPNFTAHLS